MEYVNLVDYDMEYANCLQIDVILTLTMTSLSFHEVIWQRNP
jgi:hypothetical protein